jgi:hypothetical protein
MENQSQKLLEQILARLEELSSNQTNSGISPEHVYLDNQEFMQLLKISPRTAQNYRDSGYISFSQIGSKIHYRLADIHEMLEKHKRKAFKS